MKNKKYYTAGTGLKCNEKIIERGQIGTHNTQIHDRSLHWLDTDTSVKSGDVKQALLP